MVLMSGSALSPWAISRDAEWFTRYLAKAVNCGVHSDSSVLLECLRGKPVDELIKVNLQVEEAFKSAFAPMVDGVLLPAEPRILMESKNDSSHHLSFLPPSVSITTHTHHTVKAHCDCTALFHAIPYHPRYPCDPYDADMFVVCHGITSPQCSVQCAVV